MKTQKIYSSFSGKAITKYSGLNPIKNFLKEKGFLKTLARTFPTKYTNSTKFENSQVLFAIIFASLSGTKHLNKITNLTLDPLVQKLLGLEKHFNKNLISSRLKELGEQGAISLEKMLTDFTLDFISKNFFHQKNQTIDADSTVNSVCGNQEGAEKGYNPTKHGAKSYHPLLAFDSESKAVLKTKFRKGSAYTSSGICEFLKELHSELSASTGKVFFRADSGFFRGELFDLLENESFNWDYLVKVKLKNLTKLLESQSWKVDYKDSQVSFCEFEYKCKSWSKARTFRAIRTLVDYREEVFFSHKHQVPIFKYACYCTNQNLTPKETHESYKRRSTSETWIEQIKSQAMAGKTLTNNFHANDILWQLGVFSYNLSLMIRFGNFKNYREEIGTFRDWFICVPGKLISRSRRLQLLIYKHYFYKNRWLEQKALLVV